MSQPPSGGCVLKPCWTRVIFWLINPAAFGRLCVETWYWVMVIYKSNQPPSGGCVLKPPALMGVVPQAAASRLRAAVC